MPCAGNEEDSDQSTMPKPSLEDSNEWIFWYACQLETPVWWPELREVPNQMDLLQVTRGLRVQEGKNDYSALPAPKCLGKEWVLLLPDPQMASQDYHLWQPLNTLAYAKALQYWLEKAQLPIPGEPCHLAESILELRWAMELFTTFLDSEVPSNDTAPSDCDVCCSC